MPLTKLVTEAKKNTPQLIRTMPAVQQMQAPAGQAQSATVQVQSAAVQAQQEAIQVQPVTAQAQPVPKFIDADAVTAGSEPEPPLPTWQKCQYVKNINGKAVCTQYSSLCVMEKCKQRYMINDYFAYKRFMKK